MGKVTFISMIRSAAIRPRKYKGLPAVVVVILSVVFTVFFLSLNGGVESVPTHAAEPSTVPTQGITYTVAVSPTETLQPTLTPMPSTPVPSEWDRLEPNNGFDDATLVSVNSTEAKLTLHVIDSEDVDFFTVFGKKKQILRISTFLSPGTDTRIALYTSSGKLLVENDDKSATDLGSSVKWVVDADQWLYIEVKSSVPGMGGIYDISTQLEEPDPTATPKPPEPTKTPVPKPVTEDEAEPNNHAGEAKDIVGGTTYRYLLPSGDLDYYRFFIEEGVVYRCDTYPTGVDTVMAILDQNQTTFIENNNRKPSDIGSTAEWRATYTGYVFVMVRGVVGDGDYDLICTGVEPTPVPSGGGGGSAPTTEPTVIPTMTPTPANLTARFLSQVNPTPTLSLITTVNVRVVYDANNDGVGDLSEGVENISVRAVQGGVSVAWALTDKHGEATLTISGDVERVIIPLIGWDQSVKLGDVNDAVVLIPPVKLPVVIPVEMPEEE